MLHAKNYATLLNTSVGTKEMVHRIFKKIVPRTNLKNVSLDLLKRYNTLFALRHLLDGGIDFRFSKSNRGFTNLPHHLKRLMSDWFITKDKAGNDANENVDEDIEGIPISCYRKFGSRILLTNDLFISLLLSQSNS